MTEIVVADCCPGCNSPLVFESKPGEWRLWSSAGLLVRYCPLCGLYLAWKPQPACQHKYTSAVCTDCGETLDLSNTSTTSSAAPVWVDDPGGHG